MSSLVRTIYMSAILAVLVMGSAAMAGAPDAAPLTAAELKAYLAAFQDSDYATTESADYSTTAGVRQAAMDILAERWLADRARKAGVASDPVAMAAIQATERNLLALTAQEGLRGQTTVTREQIETFYHDHPTSFVQAEKVRMILYSIAVPTGDKGVAAQARMRELRDRLSEKRPAGPGFDNVTSANVTASRGELPPEVDDIIFAARTGDLTQPFRRPRAWYLASIIEHIPKHTSPLAEVQREIISVLSRQTLQDRQTEIEKQLASEMPLVIDREALASQVATPGLVVGRVGETSITLADIWMVSGGAVSGKLDSQEQAKICKAMEGLANMVRVASWARRHGYGDSEAIRFDARLRTNKVLAKALLDSLQDDSSPTQAQLRDFLSAHKADPVFSIPKEYTVEGLSLEQTTSPMGLGAEQRKALEQAMSDAASSLRKQIVDGGNPRKIAEGFKHTSMTMVWKDLGTAPQGPRGHVVDKAVQNLKPGGVSEVVPTSRGLAFFKLDDVSEPRDLNLASDAGKLRELWKQDRVAAKRKALVDQAFREMAGGLKEKAVSEYLLKRNRSEP